MANFYDSLDSDLQQFIEEQKIFFTATAADGGRINLSPKGMDTFRCLSQRQVGYLNLTGSGNETAAHLLADGRITIMFCGFEKRPLILRLYGHGRTVHAVDEEWATLAGRFPEEPGARQIIIVDIESVQTSCGFAVPFYEHQGPRLALRRWAEQKGPESLDQYRSESNRVSIDGLPTGLPS